MSKLKVFCFGFGQVAESFINKLIIEKKDFDLSITSRQETHQIEFNNLKITSFFFNNDQFDDTLKTKLEDANYILISIPPIDSEDIVANFLDTNYKKIENCNWITYLSATSVYGDHKGDWVNEKSETKPTSPTGTNRLKAENIWIETGGTENKGNFLVKSNGHIAMTAGEKATFAATKICMIGKDQITLSAKGPIDLLCSDLNKSSPLTSIFSIFTNMSLANLLKLVDQECGRQL